MKKNLFAFITLYLLASFSGQNLAAQSDDPDRPLQYGRNPVGFKIIKTYDRSRNFRSPVDYQGNRVDGETSRPIRILLWYPAARSSNLNRMPFSEYVDHRNEDGIGVGASTSATDKVRSEFRQEITRRFGKKVEITDEYFKKILNRRTQAQKNAPHSDKKFPLLLYTSMDPTTQSVLAEYFASHGYVVAAIQRKDNMSLEFRQFRPNQTSLDTSVADIEFLYGYFHKSSFADRDLLGTIAFSSASLANIIFHMRNLTPGALVTFEGWESFKRGDEIIRESNYFEPVKLRVPYLRIGKLAEERQKSYATTQTFFDQIKYSERYDFRFKEAVHASFLSTQLSIGTFTKKERIIYKTALRKLRKFLGANLKNDRSDKVDMLKDGAENELDAIYQVSYRSALPAAPSEEEFFRMLETDGGIQKATKIYYEVKKREPNHKIFRENIISRVASRRQSKNEQLILREIIADAYPSSFRAVFNLGAIQGDLGDRSNALRNINSALNLVEAEKGLTEASRKRFVGIMRKELAKLREED